MAIGTVIRRTGGIFVYDERGRQTGIISVPPSDELQGYTGSTVGVQRAGSVFIYNERGQQVGVAPGAYSDSGRNRR
jgi:hypothetical protein